MAAVSEPNQRDQAPGNPPPARAPEERPSTRVPVEIGFPTRMVLMLVLLLLVLEFIFGVATALLYATPPTSYGALFSGQGPHDFAFLVAHVGAGYALGLLSILLMVMVLLRHAPFQAALSGVGLVGITVAGIAGMQFLESGGQSVWSLAMALAFFAALVTYGFLARTTRPRQVSGAH